MAARRPMRPVPITQAQVPGVADAPTQRALTVLAETVRDLQGRGSSDVVTADLVIGTNKVRHGLGRACIGYHLTPTYATIAFGHAIDRSNPHPELEVWITVVGSDQTAAVIEVF